jgi:putative ABC transport system permease protein
MIFLDLIRSSISNFRAHKLRAFLTVLGIVIGVMTIISIVSLIQGMNESVEQQIQAIGSNTIMVQKAGMGSGRLDVQEITKRKDLTIRDAEAIANLPAVAMVSPLLERQIGSVKYRGRKAVQIAVGGCNADYQTVGNFPVAYGRFISRDDYQHRGRVCVIGQYIVDNLFPNEDPVGRQLTMGTCRFLIIGVLQPKGSFLGQSQDDIILMPYTTFAQAFPKELGFGGLFGPSIQVMAKSTRDIPTAVEQIRELLRRRRGLSFDKPDNFDIATQDMLRDVYKRITSVAFIVMVAVAAISLLVGGIGIMNIMLVSVTERTREIGLRKAVGASRQSILYLFLAEAVILSGLGGVIGVGLGLGVAGIVGLVSPLKAAAPIWTIFLGFGFSAAVGIFFGIYPASRAAKLNSIEALRHE